MTFQTFYICNCIFYSHLNNDFTVLKDLRRFFKEKFFILKLQKFKSRFLFEFIFSSKLEAAKNDFKFPIKLDTDKNKKSFLKALLNNWYFEIKHADTIFLGIININKRLWCNNCFFYNFQLWDWQMQLFIT